MKIQDIADALHRKGHNVVVSGHQGTITQPGIRRVLTVVVDDGPELEIETTLGLGKPYLRYFSIKDPAFIPLVDEYLKDKHKQV